MSRESRSALLNALTELPALVSQTLSSEYMTRAQDYAADLSRHHDVFYIGRNLDSATCLEGSLKLKEIAYVHSEAYAAGELKHGPISLIEPALWLWP